MSCNVSSAMLALVSAGHSGLVSLTVCLIMWETHCLSVGHIRTGTLRQFSNVRKEVSGGEVLLCGSIIWCRILQTLFILAILTWVSSTAMPIVARDSGMRTGTAGSGIGRSGAGNCSIPSLALRPSADSTMWRDKLRRQQVWEATWVLWWQLYLCQYLCERTSALCHAHPRTVHAWVFPQLFLL